MSFERQTDGLLPPSKSSSESALRRTSAEVIAAALTDERQRFDGSWLASVVAGVLFLLAAFLGASQPQSEPPGVAAAIWPAAGVTVAAGLLIGRRAWLVLVLASLTFNVVTVGSGVLQVLPTILLLSVGVVLQAAIAVALVRRFVPDWQRLLTPMSAVLFIACIGPIPSLLNATVTPLVMYVLGFAPIITSPFQALAWWTGDTIGAVTIVPIALAFFALPRACWKPRRLRLALPLFLLLVGAAWDFHHELSSADEQRDGELTRAAEVVALELRSDVLRSVEVTRSVVAYFHGSEEVSESEFETFVDRAVTASTCLQALLWVTDAAPSPRIRYSVADTVDVSGLTGFDDVPEIAAALEAARASGESVSLPIQSGRFAGMIAFAAAVTTQPSEGRLVGWAVAIIGTEPMVAEAALRVPLIACAIDAETGRPLRACGDGGARAVASVDVVDRTWEVTVRDAEGRLMATRNRRLAERYGLWLMLALGVASSMLAVTGRNIALALETEGRRRAEEALGDTAAALRDSNAELEQFARMASHDLRAPLRAIKSLSEWIEKDAGPRLIGDSLEHLQLLRSRVSRLDAMVEGLLQFSRAGRWRHPTETIDVEAMVDEVADLYGDDDLRVTRTELPKVDGHRAPLQQVFSNLIGNAGKHSGGRTVNVKVSSRPRGPFVEFRVEDDGPGIDERDRETVFEPFRTLKARDQVEGSGMGLATVRRLIAAEGGEIWVEEAVGGGAAFVFTWPRIGVSGESEAVQ